MKPVGIAALWVADFAIIANLASGCGGRIEIEGDTNVSNGATAAQAGGAVVMGGTRSTGGAVGTGGTLGSGGGAAAGGATNTEVPNDAGICSAEAAISALCGSSCCGLCNEADAKSADLIDCAIRLNTTLYIWEERSVLFVNCTVHFWTPGPGVDAGTSPNGDSWTLDYSVEPPRLMLGETLCEEVQAQGNVPIYMFQQCTCIN